MDATEHEKLSGASPGSEIYRQYSSWLASVVRKGAERDHVEDIVQETFLRISKYPADVVFHHPKALLLKIARNVMRSSARSARAARNLAPVIDPMGPECVARPDQFETVLLKQTILALPEIYRDVFLLSRFGDMSYAQIAEARDISVKTVEWRMTRALAMCAAKMRE